ncbi:hypothetical protein RBSH_02466 [Rhodopirellula baltica SH28]|uniref:Uncharacterized protein n=1 Tax=Rhodopirellula baltica SH28 TaxID=993517 RepID=K5CED5_RHOBT|nr:hypothetical protein RBSH_02466 [Rhodopirellula baltica SH28]
MRVDSTRKRSGIEPRGLAFHRRHDISRCPTGDRCRISAHNAGRRTRALPAVRPRGERPHR